MEFPTGGEEGNSSKFNAGMLLIQRIHKILDEINTYKSNPTAWNPDKADWNYNLIFRGINAFATETQSKYSPNEVKDCKKYQEDIARFMLLNPIIANKSMVSNKENVVVNHKALAVLIKHLERYEQLVRRIADGRGFMSPNQRDKKKAILRM